HPPATYEAVRIACPAYRAQHRRHLVTGPSPEDDDRVLRRGDLLLPAVEAALRVLDLPGRYPGLQVDVAIRIAAVGEYERGRIADGVQPRADRHDLVERTRHGALRGQPVVVQRVVREPHPRQRGEGEGACEHACGQAAHWPGARVPPRDQRNCRAEAERAVRQQLIQVVVTDEIQRDV